MKINKNNNDNINIINKPKPINWIITILSNTEIIKYINMNENDAVNIIIVHFDKYHIVPLNRKYNRLKNMNKSKMNCNAYNKPNIANIML